MTAIAAGVVGLAVGSFLNVVIYRVPRSLSIIGPSSSCPGCGAPVRLSDNVPVLSYVLLRGRCRSCHESISPRYPIVELLTALLFAGAFVRFELVSDAAFAAAMGSVLLALAFIDLEHRRVPNRIVLPATAVAAVWVVLMGILTGRPWSIVSSLGAGAAGFLILLLIALASGGMGYGDVKLAAFIGVAVGWFGWGAFVLSLFAGFVIGGVIALVLLITRRRGRKDAIPFAPMLCSGALVALFAGDGPLAAWLSVIQVRY